jgi:hypothetical protein
VCFYFLLGKVSSFAVNLIVCLFCGSQGADSFVGMLNDASVDIDEEPLGGYENGYIGIDDAKDVEEEGGDDDLEEVDAGTYEDATSKEDHITRRTTNYTEVEDEALIRAWDSVTLDGVTGTDQTGKRYWQ